jgi:acetyl-CoA acyltransferase 1
MVAQTYNVSRQKQDEYALLSHTRAARVRLNVSELCYSHPRPLHQASEHDIFKDEIIPIEIRGSIISRDDTIRPGVTAESLASLKPVFPNWGHASTTAGNASGVGDGAGICILTTRERAHKEGMPILGKWVSSAVTGQPFTLPFNLHTHEWK